MTMKAWFGIDSGKSGALAIIRESGVVELFDTPVVDVGKGSKKEYDIAGMWQLLGYVRTFDAVGAYEVVHSMPGQGVASMFAQGRGYGLWEMGIFAAGLPFDYVTPQRWKKDMLDGLPKEKSSSVIAAQRLYPNCRDQLVTPRGRTLDGRGDALLIAEWKRRQK